MFDILRRGELGVWKKNVVIIIYCLFQTDTDGDLRVARHTMLQLSWELPQIKSSTKTLNDESASVKCCKLVDSCHCFFLGNEDSDGDEKDDRKWLPGRVIWEHSTPSEGQEFLGYWWSSYLGGKASLEDYRCSFLRPLYLRCRGESCIWGMFPKNAGMTWTWKTLGRKLRLWGSTICAHSFPGPWLGDRISGKPGEGREETNPSQVHVLWKWRKCTKKGHGISKLSSWQFPLEDLAVILSWCS